MCVLLLLGLNLKLNHQVCMKASNNSLKCLQRPLRNGAAPAKLNFENPLIAYANCTRAKTLSPCPQLISPALCNKNPPMWTHSV